MSSTIGYERKFNKFLQFPDVVKGMNWFYLSSHFVVTGAFFVWLYWRDREGFSIFRDGFLLATAIIPIMLLAARSILLSAAASIAGPQPFDAPMNLLLTALTAAGLVRLGARWNMQH